jgi:hypothetical protein
MYWVVDESTLQPGRGLRWRIRSQTASIAAGVFFSSRRGR